MSGRAIALTVTRAPAPASGVGCELLEHPGPRGLQRLAHELVEAYESLGGEPVGALDFELTAADLERIEAAVPKGAAAGTRYLQAQMETLDSER